MGLNRKLEPKGTEKLKTLLFFVLFPTWEQDVVFVRHSWKDPATSVDATRQLANHLRVLPLDVRSPPLSLTSLLLLAFARFQHSPVGCSRRSMRPTKGSFH